MGSMLHQSLKQEPPHCPLRPGLSKATKGQAAPSWPSPDQWVCLQPLRPRNACSLVITSPGILNPLGKDHQWVQRKVNCSIRGCFSAFFQAPRAHEVQSIIELFAYEMLAVILARQQWAVVWSEILIPCPGIEPGWPGWEPEIPAIRPARARG